MESIYWRYYNSIRSQKFITIGLFLYMLLFGSIVHSQITEEFKNPINNFLTNEFIGLLEKSKDYRINSDQTLNLRSALSHELEAISLSINPNAIIEYDIAENEGQEIIISDKLLPFLVNYSGKEYKSPSLTLECILIIDNDYHAYYHSTNIISEGLTLRKAIFRNSLGHLELRRISYASDLPSECLTAELSEGESLSTDNVVERTTASEAVQIATVGPSLDRVEIPRISIREVIDNQGQAIIYGFIENHKENGVLIDKETGVTIKVSTLDGYFVLRKYLNVRGYKELNFRYEYGQKFITDKKLVMVKS